MVKNVFIISLLVIVLVFVILHYRYAKKVNESKDKLILSLLSQLGETNNNEKYALQTSWVDSLKNQT